MNLKRLQLLMEERGLNPFATARRAGLKPDYVRDLLREKVKEPSAEKMQALARALGVSVDFLMDEDLDEVMKRPIGLTLNGTARLPISYEVSAGTWLEVDDIRDEPFGYVEVLVPVQYSRMRQWAERVRGDSMNKMIPDGSIVHVVDQIDIGTSPAHGDIVVVVRRRAQGGLIERSLKQVEVDAFGMSLWPRSHNPRWDRPLVLADTTADDDTEVSIVGKVVMAYYKL